VNRELAASPLGRATTYADAYDPSLLFPVDRAPLRAELGISSPLPFRGVDLWTAYELSWLDASGKPQVAIATLVVPATTPRIVESKSLKLYLTALNQTRYPSGDEVQATIARDVSAAVGTPIAVTLHPAGALAMMPDGEFAGESLDGLPLAAVDAAPDQARLAAAGAPVDRALHTQLFRSVCPVTGQPDYASVEIRYRGPAIDASGLLAYLLSFRRHPGFHEHCVERIFVDLWRRCTPEALSVYARFTRRGGIDINPFRTSGADSLPPNQRTARQ